MNLREEISTLLWNTNIWEWLKMTIVDTKNKLDILLGSEIWCDYRVRSLASEDLNIVLSWLEFDKNLVRTEIIVIYDKEKPVWEMTFIITPWKIFRENCRYLQKVEWWIKILDFETLTKENIPEFVVSLWWTKILDEYRWKFTHSWFGLQKAIVNKIKDSCPENTFIEAIAQGQFYSNNFLEYREKLFKLWIWIYLKQEDLDFPLEIIWIPKKSSRSTAKFAANHLWLTRYEGVWDYKTLWLVYYWKVR